MEPTQDTPEQAPPEPRGKKIVVHLVNGRLAGMRKIIGHIDLNTDDPLPPRFDNVSYGDGTKGSVRHAGTFPRYVLYREAREATKDAPNLDRNQR